LKEIKKLKVKAFTLSFKTSSVQEKIYGTPCRRNSRTPYPSTGKTGSVDYLLVDKSFSLSRKDYVKNTRNGGRSRWEISNAQARGRRVVIRARKG
jgi:hypothetical protein